MSDRWTETKLTDGSPAWKCSSCGLVLGGAPITRAPGRCAVCSAREGAVVALVASDRSQPSSLAMIVLDREFLDLVKRYRAAKVEYERQSTAQNAVDESGNYDLDGAAMSADMEASASREQRTALALADATERRVRVSRPSMASQPPRASRPPQ